MTEIINADMVREALAHVPRELVGLRRFEWLATYFNAAIAEPDKPCPCCGVTPNGDTSDGDWRPQ